MKGKDADKIAKNLIEEISESKKEKNSRSPSPRHKDYSSGRRRRSRSYSPRRSPKHRSRSPRRSYRDDYDDGYRARSRSYSPEGRYSGRSYGYRRPPGGRNRRSRSRSPMSSRRRHLGNRDDPEPGRCIGVFGLSLHTRERELRDVFDNYGNIETLNIVYDHQTGRSRGFAFISYREDGSAKEGPLRPFSQCFGRTVNWWGLDSAKDACNGIEIDGRKIRVDYSITERAHTPTPGIYLGRPTSGGGGGGGSGGGGGGSGGGGGGGGGGGYRGRRSPSPYRGGRKSYYRSRSRSYSPRRY